MALRHLRKRYRFLWIVSGGVLLLLDSIGRFQTAASVYRWFVDVRPGLGELHLHAPAHVLAWLGILLVGIGVVSLLWPTRRLLISVLDLRFEATEVTVIADPYRANYSMFALVRLVSTMAHPITIIDCHIGITSSRKRVSARMSSLDFSKWRIFWESSEPSDFGYTVKKPHYEPLPPLFPGVSVDPLTNGVQRTGWVRFDLTDLAEQEISHADNIVVTFEDAMRHKHRTMLRRPWPKEKGILAEPSWLGG